MVYWIGMSNFAIIYFIDKMGKNVFIRITLFIAVFFFSSCGEYTKLLKSTNYEYKYEAAKNYFAKGRYERSATLLNELITILKGTDKGEESLYMLGMSYYNMKDYLTASQSFVTYYTTYPHGTFTELARFYSGKSLYLDTPEARLDQANTYHAIQELQNFLEYYPQSPQNKEAYEMVFTMQNRLVLKEYISAKLYYDLGNYMGNNFQSCVITAQNALKDYPYTNLREDLSILILRARYEMAIYSVNERRDERYRETIDEYYAFKNEFPESKYLKEADKIFHDANKEILITN
ncbi:Outer membrane protein assembly factor BamD [termite gut metagenome]|uniref:Outer membrane protein assembly factor BamD n=1 Tax=termite gut metagenome TaxID=433724 RepID=A0A5J4RFN8_9ZZZZ